MTVTEYRNDHLGEMYVKAEHKSGLTVYICPKPDYSTAYAVFGTKYGSVDSKFKKDKGEWIEVPAGIAHFLEHKLFESEDGDAFSRYAKTGAYANAYTSFDRTCYLFSCSDRFEENLDILLDFVQSPYFTKETVQKEQGIIGQEIRMYEDNANWCVFFNLLSALYKNHSVKINIAGTVESIAQITDRLLYDCYYTFYNLSNMFICVVGNVDIDKTLKQIESSLKESEPVEIERSGFSEPREVVKHYIDQKLPVSQPLFCLGYKDECGAEIKPLDIRIHTLFLLMVLMDKASPLFKKLVDEGLINENIGLEYFAGFGYAASIIKGESSDPKRVAEEINSEIKRLKTEGIDQKLFEGIRRKLYGAAVMVFNDVENIGYEITDCAINGNDLYDTIEIIRNTKIEDVINRLEAFDEKYMALSVISPN
ncbi:MAG TPA: insulinase family protein [Clostridiales bacterium]|nr:insulinase family protein [Clostridiales bacterium]